MAEPISPDSETSIRPFLKPVIGWVAASTLAFGVLAVGMDQASKHLPVDSPELPGLAAGPGQAPGGQAPGGQAPAGEARSYPSPSFRLATLEGRDLGPQDYLGQVVVIDLWASWCGPCRMQAQFLETLHREYDGKGVQFLAINSGEDAATVEAYVQRTPFPYPVLMDPGESVMRRYQATGLPTMMIVDITGQISYLKVGVTDVATLRREVEKAKKGRNTQLAV